MTALREAIEENTRMVKLLLVHLEKAEDRYISTEDAMRLLKVSNPRVMKPVREWGLLTKFNKKGRNIFYDKEEVKELAEKVLTGKIMLPKC